ncbi:hypothetical protein SAMN05421820_1231 [Pedobacter steynii]|uniref:Uncharacterized protein n=1 Tax=Pedobacter steynii TaxID=430522 RepID=A0A1H0MFB1_9SPHI|nr:hypothetical protein SAMN05421820_1231 [Pedobacter steynii]
MERARWNTELSYKKLNFESVQLFGVTPKMEKPAFLFAVHRIKGKMIIEL